MNALDDTERFLQALPDLDAPLDPPFPRRAVRVIRDYQAYVHQLERDNNELRRLFEALLWWAVGQRRLREYMNERLKARWPE